MDKKTFGIIVGGVAHLGAIAAVGALTAVSTLSPDLGGGLLGALGGAAALTGLGTYALGKVETAVHVHVPARTVTPTYTTPADAPVTPAAAPVAPDPITAARLAGLENGLAEVVKLFEAKG